jgi:hypothetical protein
MKRFATGLGAIALTLTALLVPASATPAAEAAAPAAPVITVTPDTGLLDGQTVTLAGEGFLPAEPLVMLVCAGELCAPDYRGLPTGSADINGVLDSDQVVSRLLFGPDGTVHDCALEACTMRVTSWETFLQYGDVPLTFDAAVPPPALPALVVSPSTGLVDGQSVQVTGSGFQRGFITVLLMQCRTGATTPADCVGGVGPRGDSFVIDLTVTRFLDLPSGRVDCAVAGACTITSNPGTPGPLSTSAAIQFASTPDVIVTTPSFTG